MTHFFRCILSLTISSIDWLHIKVIIILDNVVLIVFKKCWTWIVVSLKRTRFISFEAFCFFEVGRWIILILILTFVAWLKRVKELCRSWCKRILFLLVKLLRLIHLLQWKFCHTAFLLMLILCFKCVRVALHVFRRLYWYMLIAILFTALTLFIL